MQTRLLTIDIELSPHAKRVIRWLVLPLAVFLPMSAAAFAYDTSWIAAGATVQSSKLKSDLDEIQTRLAALEVNAVTNHVLLVTSSTDTNNVNTAFHEVKVVCPTASAVPVTGGCYATANVAPPGLLGSFPYRDASGEQGWICRFEPTLGESYFSFALCSGGSITPVGAFPSAGL